MLVELIEVSGPKDEEIGRIYPNPHHVVLVEPAVKGLDADAQRFVCLVYLRGIGRRRVLGSPSEIKRTLTVGAR